MTMGNIGALLTTGQGVEQDLNEAMRWFLRAKAQGLDMSQQKAGGMGERKRQNAVSHQTARTGGS